MASISSLMGSSSSSSSIYGSRNTNIISGLASGLDTESLIEGMVESYKQKITSLQQDRTKLQWQQDAYQSISDKLVEFARKYTSYSSSTNLFSNAFFNNAVTTTAKGQYADLVTALGKSSSEVILNGVKQLASATKYTTSATSLGANGASVTGGQVDLGQPLTLSRMDGTLSITYGSQTIELEFGVEEDFSNDEGTLNTAALQSAINDKLKDIAMEDADGNSVLASSMIEASVDADGLITLKDLSGKDETVYASGASGNLSSMVSEMKDNTIQMKVDEQVADKYDTRAEYLSDKVFSVTLNGQTKSVTLGEITCKDDETWNEATQRTLQEALDDAFGSNRIKVQLGDNSDTFSFEVGEGDTFSISAEKTGVGEILFGEGNDRLTTYLDTGKTLEDLFQGADGRKIEGAGEVKQLANGTYVDKDGNKVDQEGYLLNEDGSYQYEYDVEINGVKIGTYREDTALETVINAINSNTDVGVSVSYSKLTNEFLFTSDETGAAQQIQIGAKTEEGTFNLASKLFGTTVDENGALRTDLGEQYSAGQDAQFTATVNGKTTTYTRSSNTVDLDGLTLTLSGTFDPAYVKNDQGQDTTTVDKTQGVTFSSVTDADTIVDTIKQMVEDYNAILTEVKKAYSDTPLKQTDGSRYEPLTADDEADMTESEIAAYEEKAKTGILFMDSDLNSLYSALRNAVISSGNDGSYLRSIGINTNYEDGLTTISLDEAALREALASDPEGVKNAFTKSTKNGAATNGLMASIQEVTDKYAATTGATKGILIEKAGSQYSPATALDNDILDKMEDIDEEIAEWQDKMSDKVDYYTNKFTQLELLINQMNSQSSALAGLTGGSY